MSASPCLQDEVKPFVFKSQKGDIHRTTPQLTFNTSVTFFCASIRAAVLISSETGKKFSAAGPELRQCSTHVLNQPVVLHQLSMDPPPCHLVFHETSLHHGAQLLFLRHLALQARHLLTALHQERVSQMNVSKRVLVWLVTVRNGKYSYGSHIGPL